MTILLLRTISRKLNFLTLYSMGINADQIRMGILEETFGDLIEGREDDESLVRALLIEAQSGAEFSDEGLTLLGRSARNGELPDSDPVFVRKCAFIAMRLRAIREEIDELINSID